MVPMTAQLLLALGDPEGASSHHGRKRTHRRESSYKDLSRMGRFDPSYLQIKCPLYAMVGLPQTKS